MNAWWIIALRSDNTRRHVIKSHDPSVPFSCFENADFALKLPLFFFNKLYSINALSIGQYMPMYACLYVLTMSASVLFVISFLMGWFVGVSCSSSNHMVRVLTQAVCGVQSSKPAAGGRDNRRFHHVSLTILYFHLGQHKIIYRGLNHQQKSNQLSTV